MWMTSWMMSWAGSRTRLQIDFVANEGLSFFERRKKNGCLSLPLFSLSTVATSFLQQNPFANTTCEQEKQLWAAAKAPFLAKKSQKFLSASAVSKL
jgi:hypothetical protein